MEDEPSKTVLRNATEYMIVGSEQVAIRIDQKAATSIDLDPFDLLLDGDLSGAPTRIFKHCTANVAVPELEATASSQGIEKNKHYRSWFQDGEKRLGLQTRSELEVPTSFRPFNKRYWIGEEIGNGGMGLVYLGWDLQLQRHVAIKIIREDHCGNEQHLLRFLREARIASQLRHPSILGIHDFDVEPSGSAYIIMDRITGTTLEQAIAQAFTDESKRQSMLSTFLQICQAMAFAHANGVVHRDLKPANIMVGEYGTATVLEWGLAKVLGTESETSDESYEARFASSDLPNMDRSNDAFHTLHGTVMGTPYYLAPEQARGEVVDFRADVFSLGGILCHLLTGSPPFQGGKLFEVYQKSVAGDISHAFEQLDRCGAPIPIVQLAKRCLDPNVAGRPADASGLVKTLREYLESGQRRAEEELVRFFDLSLDLFCIANIQGYFWRLNENFTRTLGYISKELTTNPFIEFVHPEDRMDTLNEIQKLSRGEPTIQFINRYRHKDGHYIFLEWTARSLQEEGVIYAVARDISDRIRLQEEKSRIESDWFRLSEIVDSASDAIIGKDLYGLIQSWNSGAEKLFGYQEAEMLGQHITKLLPSDRIHEEDAILHKIRQGERVDHFETVRLHRSGEPLDISVSISPIHDPSGKIIGASKIARSIVKQRKLESELAKSRKTLVEFAENANVPLHCVDQRGIIVWANHAELTLLGYASHEYIGQPIAKFHANQATINDIFNELTQGNTLANYRAQLIAKDGSIKDVAIYSSAFQEDGKLIHTRCFTIDLTTPLNREAERQRDS
ncbi:MAG: PAS domain S-box protein [Planctomycetes bacterium]|nr:PAS domain S-box protein [Planctomycetota bacterium]